MSGNFYNLLKMAIENKNNGDNNKRVLNEYKVGVAKKLCDAAEELAESVGCTSYWVEIDNQTQETCIIMECDELISETNDSPLLKVIRLSKSVRLSHARGKNSVNVVFVTDPVFD